MDLNTPSFKRPVHSIIKTEEEFQGKTGQQFQIGDYKESENKKVY